MQHHCMQVSRVVILGLASACAAFSTDSIAGPIDPSVFSTNYQNVLRGPSRFNPNANVSLEISVGVYPSPDSDLLPPLDVPDLELSTNGTLTRVLGAHPVITGGAYEEIFFGGLTSGRGYGWGQFANNVSRAQFDPDVNPDVALPWQIRVENPDSPTVQQVETTSPALDPNALPGLVTDVSISGAGLNPTISWTPNPPQSGTQLTGFVLYRVTDEGGITAVHSQIVADSRITIPSAFSGTAVIDPLDTAIRVGQTYMVLILNNVLDDDGRSLGRAQSFFEFTAQENADGDATVFIPTVTQDTRGNKVFNFNIEVTAGEQILIDPDVAIGYEYAVGLNDPLFASVQLPEIHNADPFYDLFLFDGTGNLFDTAIDIIAGELFDFTTRLNAFGIGAEGLARFAIKGIEPEAFLDPSDPQGFVTGLTFVGSGRFTGFQKPLTEFFPDVVPIDEPATWLLVLAGLGFSFGRRPRSATAGPATNHMI